MRRREKEGEEEQGSIALILVYTVQPQKDIVSCSTVWYKSGHSNELARPWSLSAHKHLI